jgi:hypothetical protein
LGGFDNNSDRILYLGGGGWNTPDATQIRLYTASAYNQTDNAGTERLRIDSSGNVGIGRSPSYALDVYKSGATTSRISALNDNVVTTLEANGSTTGYSGTISNHPFGIITNNAERLRIDSSGNVTITSTGVLGYGAGSGGTVTQATSRTTGVTLNKTSGAITLVSAAGTTTWQSLTVTNSTVSSADVIIVSQKSGTDLYEIHVTAVSAGSFRISYRTTGGTTTEQPVFTFAVINASTS